MKCFVKRSLVSLETGNLSVFQGDSNHIYVMDSSRTNYKAVGLDSLGCNNVAISPGIAPSSVEGVVYYDSTAHKLKVRGASGWETVSSA